MTVALMIAPRQPDPRAPMRSAAELLQEARAQEGAARIPDAIACYERAIAAADRAGEPGVLAEALRRLAVLRYQRSEPVVARALCRRSHSVATEARNDVLAAEALNTLGVLDLKVCSLPDARQNFLRALELGGQSRQLRARVEQNLGILANIQGDFDEALVRYRRSLEAYHASNDEQGCAIAYNNLGMASADHRRFDEAEGYFRQSYELAERLGDARLQGLCLVNHAEVHVARGRYEDARSNAEAALALFDRFDVRHDKTEAYRLLGVVYRETGRSVLAESRLQSAIELARNAGSLLGEAEATRELALLYQMTGRNQEALTLLHVAHRLFGRLDARADLVYVDGKRAELEATYLAVVREWAQSIESSDTYTFGHCERVARYSVAVAQALGMDEHAQTTIRLGAYLHDVGKVKVPHEILNKPGPLTRDEFEVVRMHPIWGIELLAAVEFPWDLKAIIRWHHEKHDGTGYPDRLRGDEIPLSAQVVGIVDVYDALTSTRSYRPALSHARALAEMKRCRGWWSAAVYEAFLESLAQPLASEGRAPVKEALLERRSASTSRPSRSPQAQGSRRSRRRAGGSTSTPHGS
ncbi:MAG TPA: HD domain-containing phosphohydrolase [Gemmatimonadales bacterium]|nr:HD domain-containing phosphohydrolase [Gemmatimonadales bacterium]